jgi:hypothetical protein
MVFKSNKFIFLKNGVIAIWLVLFMYTTLVIYTLLFTYTESQYGE